MPRKATFNGRGDLAGSRQVGDVIAAADLLGQRAAFDLFAAHERRVDGYPTSREASSWLEFGFRLGTP